MAYNVRSVAFAVKYTNLNPGLVRTLYLNSPAEFVPGRGRMRHPAEKDASARVQGRVRPRIVPAEIPRNARGQMHQCFLAVL